jgi:NADH-quinone oxidoreductase subunit C
VADEQATDEAATTGGTTAVDTAVATIDVPDVPGVPDTADAAPAVDEAAAANETLRDRVVAELGDAVVAHEINHGVVTIRVTPESWRRCAEIARTRLGFDYLSFVAGIDWMPAPKIGGEEASGDTSTPAQPMEQTYGVCGSAGRFQVFAAVISTAKKSTLVFKSDVSETEPIVQSWVSVYPGADWHERETWEMYGFRFDGHPGLRHLYLPGEFEGHPLRKDFPLLAREVKPWPGLVDVEPMPGVADGDEGEE